MHDHLHRDEDYYDAMNRWYEYEFREWKVDCLVCVNADRDTQIELERKGWELTDHGTYCPDCAMQIIVMGYTVTQFQAQCVNANLSEREVLKARTPPTLAF